MLLNKINNYDIILASKSPRRQQLLNDLGVKFIVQTQDVEETFPDTLVAQEIPIYLSQIKAKAFDNLLSDNNILITADTIVWVDNQVLNKPEDEVDATRMLKLLSGKKHEVYTGVTLNSKTKTKSFYAVTEVYFKELSNEEISYYVHKFKPLDKAGSYGVQEFIGYIGVEKIVGTYYNVMGLPVKELYDELLNF